MNNRTIEDVLLFSSAFQLPGFDGLQQPGLYRVDHDEEAIEGISVVAWRRVGSFIHLPAISGQGFTQQMVPISVADLEALITKDSAS